MTVEGRAGHQRVDARPADALNLAVRVGAPVVMEAGIVEQEGIPGTHDTKTANAFRRTRQRSEGREAIAAQLREMWKPRG